MLPVDSMWRRGYSSNQSTSGEPSGKGVPGPCSTYGVAGGIAPGTIRSLMRVGIPGVARRSTISDSKVFHVACVVPGESEPGLTSLPPDTSTTSRLRGGVPTAVRVNGYVKVAVGYQRRSVRSGPSCQQPKSAYGIQVVPGYGPQDASGLKA